MDLTREELAMIIDGLLSWAGEFHGIADMSDVEDLANRMELYYETTPGELFEIRKIVQKSREESP